MILAHSAPLGMIGFGMATVLPNIHRAGLFPARAMTMILAMGLIYGGIGQIVGWP